MGSRRQRCNVMLGISSSEAQGMLGRTRGGRASREGVRPAEMPHTWVRGRGWVRAGAPGNLEDWRRGPPRTTARMNTEEEDGSPGKTAVLF